MPKRTLEKVSRRDVYDAFQQLYQQLSDGYWASTSIDAKDRIRGLADAVSEILTELNRDDIESRTDDFKTLTDIVKVITPRLAILGKEIDQVIYAVKIGQNVAKAVDTAIGLAAKYFKI